MDVRGPGSTARRTWSSAWRPRRSNSRNPACAISASGPGSRFPYGHTHKTQEEVYVVVRGSGRMKFDDEIVVLSECRPPSAPARTTWRGLRGRVRRASRSSIGAPSLGDARREDVEGQRDSSG